MIYYQSYGENNNDVLVLLHSGGMAGIEWQPQISILAKYFRLLVP
ncbi:MAG: alpha/beta hydrolase, partial [Gammaproteobacteria bacterium]